MTAPFSTLTLLLVTASTAWAVPITAPTVATYGQPVARPANDVAAAGDHNGDGLDDLLLGDPTGSPAGMAYMRFGGAPPGFSPPVVTITGITAGDSFGAAVDGIGDFNCDGLPDIVVGAPTDASWTPGHGAVYVFFGPMFPGVYPAPAAGLILLGEFPGDLAGAAVQLIPDVDFDQCSDLLIGAPGNSMVAPGAGAAYVVPSSIGFAGIVPLLTPGITKFFGITAGDGAGRSVDYIGDYEGDGRTDIIIGAPAAAGSTGQAHLVFGVSGFIGAVVPLAPVSLTIVGPQPNALFGFSVDGGSDLNLDGLSDVLIGSPGNGTLGLANRRGTVHLTGLPLVPPAPGLIIPAAVSTAWFQGVVNNGQLGWDVSFTGDYNGDGRPDLSASAPGAASGGGGGIVYIRRGVGALPPPGLIGNITMAPAPWTVTSAPMFKAVGFSLDGSRGNDGDILPDLLVGAWRAPGGAAVGRNLVGSY